MSIRQGFSFKLKPNGAQDKKMSRFAGCTRWVYNQGLAWNEERRTADPAFHLSYAKLCTEPVSYTHLTLPTKRIV